jgi:DNA-binding beta-propeller fold protein YncE
MKKLAIALAFASAFSLSAHAANGFTVSWEKLWTFTQTGATEETSRAEIAAYDALNQQFWVVGPGGIDILDTLGNKVNGIGVLGANSVAIRDGLAAVAVSAPTITDPGSVLLFNTSSLAFSTVGVGANPDMVTFTPDGTRLLVANEGETAGGVDPAGSVSIISVAGTPSVVATAGFEGFSPSALQSNGVRLIGGALSSLEPEYIAVRPDGLTALVTLQENNAVGILDLRTNAFTGVAGLGTKSFNSDATAIDPTDRDSRKELRPVDLRGLYQPDAIAAYTARNGEAYFVIANEGDAPDNQLVRGSALGGTDDVARIQVLADQSTPGDLVAMGGRSFSILDANGNIVFDSGNQIEKLLLERLGPSFYDDGRSDDKGVEPEGVAIMSFGSRTVAFIGLERTTPGVVAMFDVTDPTDVRFIDFIYNVGDNRPEGLLAIPASESWDGRYYLLVSNETTFTSTLYALQPIPEPGTYALMAAGLGMLVLVARRGRRS